MRNGPYDKLVNLLISLKYAIFFLLLLVYLPATAFTATPGHTLLGGLFIGLGGWYVFFAALCFFAVAWSLMLATGLLIDCIEHRHGPDHLPIWGAEFFSVPVSSWQFIFFTGLGIFSSAIIVAKSDAALPAAGFALLAAVVAYLVMILLCTPARLADPTFVPLPKSKVAVWLWNLLDKTPLARLFAAIRKGVSKLLHLVHIRYALEYVDEGGVRQPRLISDRFFALTNFVGLLAVTLAIGRIYFPPAARGALPPAAAFLYVLLGLAIWILLSLSCHLHRIRLSPLVAVILVMLAVWNFGSTDHFYRAHRTPTTPAGRLTPVEVVKAKPASNLVVVASAGGGILAAGWTTLALKELILQRPELAQEIRLLSTISGGSVGAAHYVAALHDKDLSALSQSEREALLEEIYTRSIKSSLAESAFGFAYLDFWRLFTGSLFPRVRDWDRGRLQEDAWCRTAAGGGRCGERYRLSSLRPYIRTGHIPSIIFGATVMETGRRVMATPLTFEHEPFHEQGAALSVRAPTLSEYLIEGGAYEADVNLWTAARLSATFAYVSPAAGAEIFESGTRTVEDSLAQQAHHMIDGGYYENFGLTSALDWLDEVLEAKITGRETFSFQKVLIIRLNTFSWSDPLEAKPQTGSISALAGPVLGLAAIRSGVATTRNEIDLNRYIDSWNERLGSDVLAQVEFRPDKSDNEQPLSWHLTAGQIEDQRKAFDVGKGGIQDAWEAMTAHLAASTAGQ